MPYSRLRDLIKAIRGCKTAADERSLIAKESASIRTAFKDDNPESRYISIAKLLYIHMLGYPAHFGQIECVKLVSSPRFMMKRLGYLGIMMLLDENQEVLTLVTNSLKNDMNHTNMYVVGLALCTLGNISSVEMARDLGGEVERLLGSSNSYIKKKAALCALRIVKKVPEAYENYVGRCRTILQERNHGVLLTGMALLTEMCKASNECLAEYRKGISTVVRHLSSLLAGGSSAEHDVNGIPDPFLQIKILRLLKVLGAGDADCSEAMHDILAQVATNTESTKNVGNAILYETVLTILDIQADNSLRVMAINILGKFLTNKDNNIRYVALNTLVKTIDIDNNAVQRHRNTIIECLRDPDISIRRRAMELALALINENNVRVLVREILLFLEVADEEFRPHLVAKICAAADKYAPNKKWYVDTVLRVLTVAGNVAKDDIIATMIKVVAQSTELQPYVASKSFQALVSGTNQEGLLHASFWCIGEFGHTLLQGGRFEDEDFAKFTEQEVIDLLSKYMNSPVSIRSKEYLMNSLIKLSVRFPNHSQQLQGIISAFQSSFDAELQQRAVEYFNLFNFPAVQSSVLEKMPPAPNTDRGPKIKDSAGANNANKNVTKQTKNANDLLLELETMAMGGPNASNGPIHVNMGGGGVGNVAPKPVDALADIFGTSHPVVQQQQVPQAAVFGSNQGSAVTSPTNSAAGKVIAYEKNGLQIYLSRPVIDPTAPPATFSIDAFFFNHGPVALTDFILQAAVPKSMKLQMLPPSATVIPPNGNNRVPITQTLKLNNPTNAAIKLRMKITFSLNGSPITEMADFAGF